MELVAASRAFAVRYYRWALDDARREVEKDFPRIRGVKGKMAFRALTFLESLSQKQRHAAARALVRRFHSEGMAGSGESMTVEDDDWVSKWLAAARIESLLEFQPRDRPSRSLFRKAVLQQLGPILSSEFQKHSSTTGVFRTQIGPWTLVTTVGFGARPFYFQHVWMGPRATLGPVTGSLLARLGITGQTTWDLLGAGNEEEAAFALASDCTAYLQTLPELLRDLSADDVAIDIPAGKTPSFRPRLAPKR